MKQSTIQTVNFKEHPVKPIGNNMSHFDICAAADEPADFMISGRFAMTQYCQNLWHKLSILDKDQIKAFVRYQCNLLAEPLNWLNSLEELIVLNRERIKCKQQKLNLDKTLLVIELLRDKLESEKLPQEKDQAISNTAYKNPPYSLKMNGDNIKNKVAEPVWQGSKKELVSADHPIEVSPENKFRINTNLNYFVDIFFQLTNEKHTNGKPYLEAKPKHLAQMIKRYFIDKDGKDISIDTVKTILKPSRIEKRPKEKRRLHF